MVWLLMSIKIWLSLAPVLDANRLALDPHAASHAFTRAHSAVASLSNGSQASITSTSSFTANPQAVVGAAADTALRATADAASAAAAMAPGEAPPREEEEGETLTRENSFGTPSASLPHSTVPTARSSSQRKPAMSEDWHNSNAYNEAAV